ncbi:BH2977 [Halalkalibacterium halodurans C-125]|uniref:BH2977 protein n=1 Tax=Halalkalibacterium halodurans (strain ATCC BAA-125 / DSM 18197 / FERM 7344 / JCM 9153 / C-125) TaxID=272558 RepID=Q9K8M8_HALH5|nr:BH2977 [Halalkalibacterium halodurans C-125]
MIYIVKKGSIIFVGVKKQI